MTNTEVQNIKNHFQKYKEQSLGITECYSEEENNIIKLFPNALPLKEAGLNLINKGYGIALNEQFIKVYDQSPTILGERIHFLDSTPILTLNLFVPLITENFYSILIPHCTKSSFGFIQTPKFGQENAPVFFITKGKCKHYFRVLYMEKNIDFLEKEILGLLKTGQVHIIIPKFRKDLYAETLKVFTSFPFLQRRKLHLIFLDDLVNKAYFNPNLKNHFSEFRKKYLQIEMNRKFSPNKNIKDTISQNVRSICYNICGEVQK